MIGLSRPFLVAVGAATAFFLLAQAIGVSGAVLKQTVVVFGLAGILTAAAVETIVKLGRSRSPVLAKLDEAKPNQPSAAPETKASPATGGPAPQ